MNLLDLLHSAKEVVTGFYGIGVGARGLGGCRPPDSGKTIIFRGKAKFFGQKT